MEVILSRPRGFCAGVIRAIEIVERALELHGAPVYVLHEIVHNPHVVDELRAKGAIFVEDLAEVPSGSVAIFSAHGVAPKVVRQAEEQELRIIDATCPLVTKVHLQARSYQRKGMELIIIGHPGHPEVDGHRGQVDGPVHVLSTVEEVERLEVRDPAHVAYITQTTLSLDDTREVIQTLKRRFPSILGPDLDDICYATQNRQNAVREMAGEIDILLVVGARNSSNSNRLREVGEQIGVVSHLIESAADLDPSWFSPGDLIGVTAGASAPEKLIHEVVDRLKALGTGSVTEMEGEHETTVFPLPEALRLENVPGSPGSRNGTAQEKQKT
ncbi:MAG: 4-hydroxy-3-methylbut-2-enyl diphosphate reductase [Planctomycetota bacterium]